MVATEGIGSFVEDKHELATDAIDFFQSLFTIPVLFMEKMFLITPLALLMMKGRMNSLFQMSQMK